MEGNSFGNRVWHVVCSNPNLDVVQVIFSLKEIQPNILNYEGYNVFYLRVHLMLLIEFKRKSDQIYSQTFPFFYSFSNNSISCSRCRSCCHDKSLSLFEWN